jgi:hypothetical protein
MNALLDGASCSGSKLMQVMSVYAVTTEEDAVGQVCEQLLFEIMGQTHLQLIQGYFKGYVKDSCSFFDVILHLDIDLCFSVNCTRCKLAM